VAETRGAYLGLAAALAAYGGIVPLPTAATADLVLPAASLQERSLRGPGHAVLMQPRYQTPKTTDRPDHAWLGQRVSASDHIPFPGLPNLSGLLGQSKPIA